MGKLHDQDYLEILLGPLRVCKGYKPKFGHGGRGGYSLKEFQQLYQADPFYSWMGLDTPLIYAAHKAAGGMTSVYRQLGLGSERLFRAVIRDSLGLSEKDVRWSYATKRSDGRNRTLRLDARIPTDAVADQARRTTIENWLRQAADILDVAPRVRDSLSGVVFEVRQGYKSKDAKRQNADIANAATAYARGYLPCAAILSLQIDEDVALRYAGEKWMILPGKTGPATPHASVYAFLAQVVGYDLAGFFERHKRALRYAVRSVLQALLAPK